jgi:hypothetical protein
MKITIPAPEFYRSTTDAYSYAVSHAKRTFAMEAHPRVVDNFQLVAWEGVTKWWLCDPRGTEFTFTANAVRPWRFHFNAWMRDRAARKRHANRLAGRRPQRWFYKTGEEASDRFGVTAPEFRRLRAVRERFQKASLTPASR